MQEKPDEKEKTSLPVDTPKSASFIVGGGSWALIIFGCFFVFVGFFRMYSIGPNDIFYYQIAGLRGLGLIGTGIALIIVGSTFAILNNLKRMKRKSPSDVED